MSERTPEERAQRRLLNWALVILALPAVVILVWANVAANAEEQKKREDLAYCAGISWNSPQAIWCADHHLPVSR